MFFGDDDSGQSLALTVLTGVVALLVAGLLGFAVQSARAPTARLPQVLVSPSAPSFAPSAGASANLQFGVDAAGAALAASDAASVSIDSGLVLLYFAPGRHELAPGASAALAELVALARGGRRLGVAGFHDLTGDPAKNAELARRRAQAVRSALLAAGVRDAQIDLKKPVAAEPGSLDAQARRVEVSLQ